MISVINSPMPWRITLVVKAQQYLLKQNKKVDFKNTQINNISLTLCLGKFVIS